MRCGALAALSSKPPCKNGGFNPFLRSLLQMPKKTNTNAGDKCVKNKFENFLIRCVCHVIPGTICLVFATFLACSPPHLHGIFHLLACPPSILHIICYILALQPRILHKCSYMLVEGSFEVKLPTIWRDGKAEVGFVALEGRKVTSLKRRVRSQLARREMKKCTPLWREAYLQVKNAKN